MAEPGWASGTPRKIPLATGPGARCDRALDPAAALAEVWKAALLVVRALERPDDFYTTDLERRLPSWHQPPDATRVVEEQSRHEILQAATKATFTHASVTHRAQSNLARSPLAR